ncbi:MAG: PorT family protein [Chlorobi bacterium]|nr:PorT family protein [Chlorobiota bacterium]
MRLLKLVLCVFVLFLLLESKLFSQSSLSVNAGIGINKLIYPETNSANYSTFWKPAFRLGLLHELFVDRTRYISSELFINQFNAKQTSEQKILMGGEFVKNDFSFNSNTSLAGLGIGLGARNYGIDFNIKLMLGYMIINKGSTKNLKNYDYISGQIINSDIKWDKFYTDNFDLGANLFVGYEVWNRIHLGLSSYFSFNQYYSKSIYGKYDVNGINEMQGNNLRFLFTAKYKLLSKNSLKPKNDNLDWSDESKSISDSNGIIYVIKTYPLNYISEVNLAFEVITPSKISHEIIAAYHFRDSYSRYLSGLYIFNFIEEGGFVSTSTKYGFSIRYNFSFYKKVNEGLLRNKTIQIMLKREVFLAIKQVEMSIIVITLIYRRL